MRIKRFLSWIVGLYSWFARRILSLRIRYGSDVKYKNLEESKSRTDRNDVEDAVPVSYFNLVRAVISASIWLWAKQRMDSMNCDYFWPSLEFTLQYRYAVAWDIVLISIGIACTFVKAMAMPVIMILYAELTTLLIDRTLEYGITSTTILLPIFGGGKIL